MCTLKGFIFGKKVILGDIIITVHNERTISQPPLGYEIPLGLVTPFARCSEASSWTKNVAGGLPYSHTPAEELMSWYYLPTSA